MELLGCPSITEYYRRLISDTSREELLELLNLLTTTETYFFRNKQQLQSFEEEVLPIVIKRKQEAGLSHIHLWSAGCSSGEEPYTLAMILLETIPDIQRWKIFLVGTDINAQAIGQARQGVYTARSLRDIPHKYKTKYFLKERGKYRICDQVKKMVTFRTGNLVDQHDSSLIQNLDCIFCRNVLIYFNVESCKTVVTMFYENLARNGYLFLGHSESLYRITTVFKLLKLQHSLVYYKE
jgi:chemotaxis protein methyltransferase CheR